MEHPIMEYMAHRCLSRTFALAFAALLIYSPPSSAASLPHHTPTDYENELVRQAQSAQLDKDPYWRTLLHYRGRLLGGSKSEVDGPTFFNAENGRTQPDAELEATIRAFFDPAVSPLGAPGNERQHPQCRFIDRYKWLKTRLKIDALKLADVPCPEYDEWKHALDPESLTVVFSSYYMNNPSSVFGHTLLRLNHRTHTDQDRLLDYGVNYAANPNTTNAFLYGLLGLTGGFKGDFSNIPYYLKVQEYNDNESRDLWEYDLNLGAPEIERLMDHLWAVGRIPISYYFLDRNCSYMLLTLLDAAQPSLKLTDDFQTPWVIPADTIRIVASRPGLIRRVLLRKSLSSRIKQQRAMLSDAQRKDFYTLSDEENPEKISALLTLVAAQPASEAAPVLDLTLDHLRLLKAAQKGKLTDQQLRFQRELLGVRAGIDQKPVDLPMDAALIEHMRPDLGHRTMRAEVGAGYSDLRGAFAEIGFRSAFHDLNANSQGYPAHAEIEVLAAQLRYYGRDQWVRLERADLVNIVSLAPLDPLFKRISWAARIGIDPVRDFDARESLEYKTQIAAGASIEPMRGWVFYTLARAELGVSGAYVPVYRLGPAAVGGTQFQLGDHIGLEGWTSFSVPLLGYTGTYWQGSAQARLNFSANTDVRIQGDFARSEDQGKLLFHVYF